MESSFAYSVYLPWLFALAWLAGGFIAGFVVDRSVLRPLAASPRIARSYWLELTVNSLRAGVVLWFSIAGIYIALHTSVLSPNISSYSIKSY